MNLSLNLSRKVRVVLAQLSVCGLHGDTFGLELRDLNLDKFNVFLCMDGNLRKNGSLHNNMVCESRMNCRVDKKVINDHLQMQLSSEESGLEFARGIWEFYPPYKVSAEF